MKKYVFVLFALLAVGASQDLRAQDVPEDQLGAWYMYFYNTQFGDGPWGFQGDFQFRYWDFGSDLEQVLLRSGLTYTPEDSGVKFTLGYANISSGTPGESRDVGVENRIYQEALFSQTLGSRFLLTHRFRYEQRFVEGQDFRTRYRYMLFVNVPFNGTKLGKGIIHLALYNELFINGQRSIGPLPDDRVQTFDRNRTYYGLGYGISDNLRVQLGAMNQTTTGWSKWQAQFSLHHSFGL